MKLKEILFACGRKVATLVNGFQQSGSYSAEFNASGLSNGVYLYKVKAGPLWEAHNNRLHSDGGFGDLG